MHEQQDVAIERDLVVQKEFWNDYFADTPENARPNPSREGRHQLAEQLLMSLKLSKPKILEVGCGSGWLSAALARHGQVTGVDLADQVLARARALHPRVDFIAGDFLTLALPVQHFDLVVSVDAISYFDDLQLFSERIASALKSSGYLILMCPHRFVWNRTDFVRRSHGEIPLNWLNMWELKKLLRKQFSVLHAETIMPDGHLGVLRLINSYRLNRLIQKIVPEPSVVRFKEWIGLGKTLVVVAQKRV